MVDPQTGYLFQPGADIIATMNKERQDKGLDPITSKHSFVSAAQKEIHIRRPKLEVNNDSQNDEDTYDYAEDIKREVYIRANDLLIAYEREIDKRFRNDLAVEKMPLALLMEVFGEAYLTNRTDSEGQQKDYRRRIEAVARIFGLMPICDLTDKMLLKLVKTHTTVLTFERLREVEQFIEYVALHRGCKQLNAASSVFRLVAAKLPRDRNVEALQAGAVDSPILPERVELSLNEKFLQSFDALSAGFVLIKEGRLSPEEVCAATFGVLDIRSGDSSQQEVFWKLYKNNYSGATHDYSFPLLPYGAYYIYEYIEHLRAVYGDERVKSDRYLIASDPEGLQPIDPAELKCYCRKLISTYRFGYGALANLAVTRKPKAVALLHNTYDYRVNEICGLKNDYGAVLFLQHKALVQSVQADSYRGFTDRTGRTFLYKSVSNDQRGIPREKTNKNRISTRTDKQTNYKVTKLPPDPHGYATTVSITLKGLKEGDIITVKTLNGCFSMVMQKS